MPSSINMPSTENEKRSMKEHIDKYLAVSSKTTTVPTTVTRAGFEPTLLPSRRFTVIYEKPYSATEKVRSGTVNQ